MAFVGLENAGKTATLKRLVKGEFFSLLMPTSGFNVDKFKYRGISVEAYDVGGQETFRNTFWRSFVPKANSVVFVVDAADQGRFQEARDALELCLGWARNKPVLLILANKNDLPEAAGLAEFISSFSLQQLAEADAISGVQIFSTSAKTGEGVTESFDWLFDTLAERVQTPEPVGAHIFVIERTEIRGDVNIKIVADVSTAQRDEPPLTMDEIQSIIIEQSPSATIEYPQCQIYTSPKSGVRHKICKAILKDHVCLISDRESAQESIIIDLMDITLKNVTNELSKSNILFPTKLSNLLNNEIRKQIERLDKTPTEEPTTKKRFEPTKMTVEERVQHVHLEKAKKTWKKDPDAFTSLGVSDRIRALREREREEEEKKEEPLYERIRKRRNSRA